jgi:hypothetical protein
VVRRAVVGRGGRDVTAHPCANISAQPGLAPDGLQPSLVPRCGFRPQVKPSVGRLRRGEKNHRGNFPGQEALPCLGRRRAQTGRPTPRGMGRHQRGEACRGEACGRVASPWRRSGWCGHRARPGAAPPCCSWVWPQALVTGAGGPRGALLAGRSRCLAGSGKPRDPRRAPVVLGRSWGENGGRGPQGAGPYQVQRPTRACT